MFNNLCYLIILPIILSIIVFFGIQSKAPSSVILTTFVSSSVEIKRDSDGIPHIYAENLIDASYAVGYAMAQNRLWQIDIIRRTSTGRLSEILGESSLEMDIFIRNIKIPQMAQRDINDLSPEALKSLTAFAAGINDGAKSLWLLPIEYYITRSTFDEFRVIDSQASHHFLALSLGMTWGNDVLRHQLYQIFGEELEYILPTSYKYSNPKSFIISKDELPEELRGNYTNLEKEYLTENIDFDIELHQQSAGSNSWAISGKYTKSGKPIIVNDPHLATTAPGIHYFFHLYLPGNNLSGFTTVGFPFIMAGRSSYAVWIGTSLKSDDIDIFMEKIHDGKYLYGDEYLNLKEFEEVIYIKGQQPRKYIFKETLHGPILENSIIGAKKMSPFLPNVEEKNLSFCFTNHYLTDHITDYFYNIQSAKTVEELRSLIHYFDVGRISMTFSTISGDIYYQATGRVPIREVDGSLVLAGWEIKNTWKGFVTHEEMPYVINPKKGFIVTANNYPTDSNYKHFYNIGNYFSQGRAERIEELIQEKINKGEKFTAVDQIKLQQDELDIFAREGVPNLIKLLNVSKDYNQQVKTIKEWDFVMSRNSKAGAIYVVWLRQIARNLIKNKVSEDRQHAFVKSLLMQLNLYKMFTEEYPSIEKICDNPETEKNETCQEIVSKSFIEACEITEGKAWGELHAQWLRHIPFTAIPFLSKFFDRTHYVGGMYSTIHSTHFDWASESFLSAYGPEMKFIADLGNNEENYWSLNGGESGNVFSSFYCNLLESHHYGNLTKFTFAG
ncbi:hypothetical protein SteCoe_19594 [Stentor coeruleus]|uniref:Penicillin acylase family protein n=1 Tax=Stentor coeruleus TaxID=5963 RepID=A0A1R2BTZ2_9CILI|nr:hypothetical protein SteCoe_19594 [Stentor coeruleus]